MNVDFGPIYFYFNKKLKILDLFMRYRIIIVTKTINIVSIIFMDLLPKCDTVISTE